MYCMAVMCRTLSRINLFFRMRRLGPVGPVDGTSSQEPKHNPFRARMPSPTMLLISDTLLEARQKPCNSMMHPFIVRGGKFFVVARTITSAGLGGKNSSSPKALKLRSLNSTQLYQLFDHSYLYNLGDFVFRNKLGGIHLEDGIDNVQDLQDLGLDKLTSKVLFKRIAAWKAEGLPEDFQPFVSTAASVVSTSYPTVHAPVSGCPVEFSGLMEQSLDDDFISAFYCNNRDAADRIVAAAEAGDSRAMAYLSILYNRGEGVLAKDCIKASHYATNALPALKEKALSGNKFAQYTLATCFADGRGVTKDEKEAVRYYKLAADQGHAGAQCSLGWCYEHGVGVIKDEKEEVKYYILAADQGHVNGQYNLGVCYYVGRGVTIDETEAVRYYKLAVDMGHVNAQYNLGTCFKYGTGVLKDEKEAVRYYKLASDQGHADAQYQLGVCYEQGKGVNKDIIEAFRYFQLAADQGQEDACEMIYQ